MNSCMIIIPKATEKDNIFLALLHTFLQFIGQLFNVLYITL